MEAGECGTLCSSLLNLSDALASLHSQEKAPEGRQHPSDPSSQEGCYPGVWGRGRVFGGISWSPNHAGCALSLPPRAGGRRNSKPCETPLHCAKSAFTLHKWPMFLCVSASMGNTAMGARRMPEMEHRMPLGHLPLPSRDTLQTSWGIICSRHTATKHPAPGLQSSRSPPRAHFPARCMGSGRVHVFAGRRSKPLGCSPKLAAPRARVCICRQEPEPGCDAPHSPCSLPSCASSPTST